MQNVLSDEQLSKPEVLKSLTTYYQTFEKFLKTVIFLEDLINDSLNSDDIINDILREICKEKYVDFQILMNLYVKSEK